MRKATSQDRKRINEYFVETGWTLDSDLEVLVFDTSEDVAKHLGHNIEGLTVDEIDELIDVRNVWYDGENTCNYYVIV